MFYEGDFDDSTIVVGRLQAGMKLAAEIYCRQEMGQETWSKTPKDRVGRGGSWEKRSIEVEQQIHRHCAFRVCFVAIN